MCGLEFLLGLITVPVGIVLFVLWMISARLSECVARIGLAMSGKEPKDLSEEKLEIVGLISSAVVVIGIGNILSLIFIIHANRTRPPELFVPPGLWLLGSVFLSLVGWFFVQAGTNEALKPEPPPYSYSGPRKG